MHRIIRPKGFTESTDSTVLYLTIVSLIWAYSFGLIGSTLTGVDSIFVASVRLGLAGLAFLPFLRLKSIPKKDTVFLFVLGAIEFGLMYLCYIRAYQYIPSHLVALFSVLTPVYVVLIHDLRQRQFTPKYLFAAVLSVLGASVIKAKSGHSGDIWIGFALMQVAGIAFAYGQVAYRDWKQTHPKVQDHQVFALLYAGATSLAFCASLFWTDYSSLTVSHEQWKALIYLGLVASGIGFFLWNKGAARTNPGTLGAFNNAVVPFAVLCSLFIFKEIESASTSSLIRLGIGGSCIFAAVWLSRQSVKG